MSLNYYFVRFRDVLRSGNTKETCNKVMKNPRVLIEISEDRARYEHEASCNYEWNNKEISEELADYYDSNPQEFLSYFEELENSPKFEQMKSKLESTDYRLKPQEFGYRKILYVITRYLKPKTIVESGVFEGVGSFFFLEALRKNERGELISIDYVSGGMSFLHQKDCGYLIPEELKEYWELREGRSINQLEPVLEEEKDIDLFYHDSKHSYTNMMYEYRTVFRNTKNCHTMSDDTNANEAFQDFTKENNLESLKVDNLGICK